MPIPSLDNHGLLPSGVYDCTLQEIGDVFATNKHRGRLFDNLLSCLRNEIRPIFDSPIYINGSFVTDKEHPEDIDIAVELDGVSDNKKWEALIYMHTHQDRLLTVYQIHFWINFASPEANDFSKYFQYIRAKTARLKGLNPKHLKGILRIV